MRIYELLQDDKHFFIVSEYVKSGELYDFVVKRGSLTETEVRKIIRQVYLSLNYMHKINIVHRDLKPENILMDSLDDLSVKLTDFGFATFFDDNDLLDEVLGSPIYMPPEIILRQKYDSKVDTWSAGVVAYILLSGRPPFTGLNKEEVYSAI